MKYIFILICIPLFLGCSPYLHDPDPPIPSPILRTPSGKIIESVLGNVILHDPPQTYSKFRVKNLDPVKQRNNTFSQGVEVTWVSDPAKGLTVGDIIVGALPLPNGPEVQIKNSQDLRLVLNKHLNTGLQLLVIKGKSKGYQKKEKQAVVLTTKKAPQGMEVLALEQAWDTTYTGLGFANITSIQKEERPKHVLDSQVALIWVSANTIAARKGLMPLDTVLAIDGIKVSNCFQAVDLIQKHGGDGMVSIQVRHPDFNVETIEVDLAAEVNELVVRKIPAIYGVKYSQRGKASSFLGVYNGTHYSYSPPIQEDRSAIWDLSELGEKQSDIIYSPKPEYFEEYYFRFPMFYSFRKTTSLKDGHGYKVYRILNIINIHSKF